MMKYFLIWRIDESMMMMIINEDEDDAINDNLRFSNEPMARNNTIRHWCVRIMSDYHVVCLSDQFVTAQCCDTRMHTEYIKDEQYEHLNTYTYQ